MSGWNRGLDGLDVDKIMNLVLWVVLLTVGLVVLTFKLEVILTFVCIVGGIFTLASYLAWREVRKK